jgi:putative oxidoreductase
MRLPLGLVSVTLCDGDRETMTRRILEEAVRKGGNGERPQFRHGFCVAPGWLKGNLPGRPGGCMTIDDRAARIAPHIRSLVRIVVGLLFLEHGLSHLFGFPQAQALAPAFSLNWFAGAIEFVGGTLVTLGLFTRPAAFIMSGEMAFAYFLSHAPHGFFPILNRGDAAILYCFIFFYLAFAGPGPWSIDKLLKYER